MEKSGNLYKQNFELRKENNELKNEIKKLGRMLFARDRRIKQLEEQHTKYVEEEAIRIEKIVMKAVEEAVAKTKKEAQTVIDELNKKITRLEKRLNTDSTNSGIPTSKNRIDVKIPNTREKSTRKIGGQPGHVAHKLQPFKEEEITEIVEHTLCCCPECGGELQETNVVQSDIIDFKVEVTKTRNNIHNYKCQKCKKNITSNKELPRGVSYGKKINATGLSLINESNVALNKVSKHISGITSNEVEMSEGYLVKLQKKSANELDTFIKDLKETILKLDKVHWDDTTVKIGQLDKSDNEEEDNDSSNVKEEDKAKVKKGVIRFYGDDKYALLIGHKNKSKDGIEEDGILANLPSSCTCIHDHVLLNYNEEYNFKNAECNQHIIRYLKGVKDNLHDHTWQDKLSELLKETNQKRNNLLSANNELVSFSEDEINEIYDKYRSIINLGYSENEKTPNYHFYKEEELKLIKRLDKFIDNHLLFIKDFRIPFTNNTAELGIRQCKRKLATSFMFKNITSMKDYAKILSYLETCYRNGISKHDACCRLVSGNPYTIKEIIELNSSDDKSEKNES